MLDAIELAHRGRFEVEPNPHYWDAATVKLNGIRWLEDLAKADGGLAEEHFEAGGGRDLLRIELRHKAQAAAAAQK